MRTAKVLFFLLLYNIVVAVLDDWHIGKPGEIPKAGVSPDFRVFEVGGKEGFNFAEPVRLIFLSCGSKEYPEGITSSVEALKAAGYNAVGHISEGTAHEFLTWRRGLREMAPLLFK